MNAYAERVCVVGFASGDRPAFGEVESDVLFVGEIAAVKAIVCSGAQLV
jgi:hypothetical protein